MMTEVDDAERAVFERALASFTVTPAPVERIRSRARARRARMLTFRGARGCRGNVRPCARCIPLARRRGVRCRASCLVPDRYGAHHRARPRQQEDHRGSAPARSLAEAQYSVPFKILVPPTGRGWRLQTIAVSDAPRYPSVEMLYRGKNGTWMKIAERPSTAAVTPRDSDLSDFLSTGDGKTRTIGKTTLTYPSAIARRSVVRTYGALRATITVPADQRSTLVLPLVPNRAAAQSPGPLFVRPAP